MVTHTENLKFTTIHCIVKICYLHHRYCGS